MLQYYLNAAAKRFFTPLSGRSDVRGVVQDCTAKTKFPPQQRVVARKENQRCLLELTSTLAGRLTL